MQGHVEFRWATVVSWRADWSNLVAVVIVRASNFRKFNQDYV
jgi:hypothetical protein